MVFGRQVGGKLIWVVADFIYVVAVFVIAAVGVLDIGNLLFQVIFQSGIVLVRP